MKPVSLSVILPTYNEEDIILNTLHEIARALKFELCQETEILIVDDGIDNLPQKIKGSQSKLPFRKIEILRNSPPLGKGASVAKGISLAQGSVVGYLDADLSTPPHYIENVLKLFGTTDYKVFIGSRRGEGASVRREQFFLKDILGHGLAVVTRFCLFHGTQNYKDTQCGFKFFKKEVAQILYQDLVAHDGLTDLEILLRCNLLELKVHEQGVQWTDLRESKRSLKRILMGELTSMIKILFRYTLLKSRTRETLKDQIKMRIPPKSSEILSKNPGQKRSK